ncbi:hypothetical protein ACJ5NV_00695 [Loktanella agnita]|uniref:hypothetical protein n=1 Tax=Loktanella agnita TaxID=287097 RepID=UPI003987EAA4
MSAINDLTKAMHRHLWRIACLILLGQPITAQGAVQVIGNDRGGFIGSRAIEITELNRTGTRVELRGRVCYSACTLYLGADDLCISAGTTFGFHGPSQHGQPLPPRQFEHWSQVMASHYNPALRRWFMAQARHRISGYYRFKGTELIAMGYPAC